MTARDRDCLMCGAPFRAKYAASQQRFCSRECVRESRAAGRVTVKPWTEGDLAFLADNEHMSAREAGRHLGRGMQSVQKKREQIRDGWWFVKERWTEDELDIVRATPNLTAEQVAAQLPGRSIYSVQNARHGIARREGVAFDEYATKSPHHVGKRRLLAKSCRTCGRFLDAEWFNRDNRRKWRSACVRCQAQSSYASQKDKRPSTSARDGGESARRIARKLQNLSLTRAVNKGKEWTEADMPVLSDPDLTAIEKALRLGRTYFATHAACRTYGFTSKVGRGDPVNGQWQIHFPKESAA